jgi:hypothetical protein
VSLRKKTGLIISRCVPRKEFKRNKSQSLNSTQSWGQNLIPVHCEFFGVRVCVCMWSRLGEVWEEARGVWCVFGVFVPSIEFVFGGCVGGGRGECRAKGGVCGHNLARVCGSANFDKLFWSVCEA